LLLFKKLRSAGSFFGRHGDLLQDDDLHRIVALSTGPVNLPEEGKIARWRRKMKCGEGGKIARVWRYAGDVCVNESVFAERRTDWIGSFDSSAFRNLGDTHLLHVGLIRIAAKGAGSWMARAAHGRFLETTEVAPMREQP
jgi:hypothetical protein